MLQTGSLCTKRYIILIISDMKTWFEKTFGSISMIVIIIPGLAYLMTFAYSIGYYTYFNVPSEMITIGADDIASMVILVMVALFALFLIDFFLVQFFFKFFFKLYPVDSKIFSDQYVKYSIIVFFICLLVPLNVLFPIPKILLVSFVSVPVLFLLSFVLSHFSFLRKKKQNEYTQITDDNEESDKEFPGIIELIIGKRIFFVVLFVLFMFVLVMSFGSFLAKKQDVFYSIDKRNDIVGVYINNDNLLIAKYLDDKELAKTEIISVADEICIELKNNPEFVKLVKDYNEFKSERQKNGTD